MNEFRIFNRMACGDVFFVKRLNLYIAGNDRPDFDAGFGKCGGILEKQISVLTDKRHAKWGDFSDMAVLDGDEVRVVYEQLFNLAVVALARGDVFIQKRQLI